jgi:hypothetical protein
LRVLGREVDEEFEALGGEFAGDVGFAGEDFVGGEEAGVAGGMEEEKLVDGVVGFVEVGGEDEQGAVEAFLDEGGEDEGGRAPLAGGGDVAGGFEAAAELGDDGGMLERFEERLEGGLRHARS